MLSLGSHLSAISAPNREDRPNRASGGEGGVLKVALPRPVDQLFDYAADHPDHGWIGCRVRVPFGRQRLVGVVVAIGPPAVPVAELEPILERLDQRPILAAEELEALEWLARYHHHPLGEVLADALPPPVRPSAADRGEGRLALAIEPEAPVRGRALARLLALLRERGPLAPAALDREFGNWRGLLRRHRARGWFRWLEPDAPNVPQQPALSPSQQAARDVVLAATGFRAFLLEGAPGSGKTELCLQLATELAADGRQTLLLLPEIAQVEATSARLRARLGRRAAAYHSGLAAGERMRVWLALAEGRLAAVVGTRSAVFLPLPRPGLIVVGEEHDPAYKQPDGARFSARDFALVRARRLNVPVLLASATPSLEALARAARGRLERIRLEPRGRLVAPSVRLADVAGRHPAEGVAPEILAAIGRVLTRGEPALVLCSRRGFAPSVVCAACGQRLLCPGCTIAFTFHRSAQALICHGCGHRQAVPSSCPTCGGALLARGHGSERLEQTLRRRFPGVLVLRVDRDSIGRRRDLGSFLAPVRAGGPCILLGTERVIHVEDLPAPAVIAALHVDAALARADFRATERFAQLFLRLAARAGAACGAGEIWLQTTTPDHPLLALLLREGYAAFAARELELRREAGLPPFSHQARLCAEGPGEAPRRFLAEAARIAPLADGLRLDGPLPALRERRAGRQRCELLLEAARREPLQQWLAAAMPAIRRLRRPRALRWFLEVDPISADWD